jgi:Glyceraldehyde-3-phosphate dehydrogenase/erythrose-4-phosphate dehydrogenase
MITMRAAINGFGRIGKMVLRALCKRRLLGAEIEVTAIADFANDADYYAYQLKYDSVHQRLDAPVAFEKSSKNISHHDLLVVNGERIKTIPAAEDPSALPWKKMGIDVVVDTTGHFTTFERASGHIAAGAQRVLLTNMPERNDIKTIIIGVNDGDCHSADQRIISNANCTANCVIPLLYALKREGIEIEKGHLTVLLPYTASRKIVDGYSTRSWRDGRSAAVNIIPSSVNAARAIGYVFPELQGTIQDVVLRVPVAEVSFIDFSCIVKKDTSIEEIDGALKKASKTYLEGIVGTVTEEIVSSDMIGDTRSSIYDSSLTIKNNISGEKRFFSIFAWYDNEWGYANRVVDLLLKM